MKVVVHCAAGRADHALALAQDAVRSRDHAYISDEEPHLAVVGPGIPGWYRETGAFGYQFDVELVPGTNPKESRDGV